MELENNIDPTKDQVFICACPGHAPFNFSLHTWLVINKQGDISRWEVLYNLRSNDLKSGHLHKNAYHFFSGIEIFPSLPKLGYWPHGVLASLEGDVASKVIKRIESSPFVYPFCDKYSLAGPNSNTYTAWVLSVAPSLKNILPWNCFGKNYQK